MFTKLALYTTTALTLLMSSSINAATIHVSTLISPIPHTGPVILAASQLADGTYQANIGGTNAVLTIASGRPISYSYGSYRAKRLGIKGNTIAIDMARLQITGLNSKTIVGVFTLNGKSQQVRFNR
jgi:hypothetical protein